MNNRYDGTNGNGYQPLPLHGDDNPKAPPRCAKPEEAEGVERQRMIESMCLTWRHDFGLDAPAPGSLASGMTESGRQHLRGEMGKLFDHHFAPVLSAVTAERGALKHALDVKEEFYQDALHSHIVLARQVNQLRAELEALRKDAERYRWLRKMHESRYGLTLTIARVGMMELTGWSGDDPDSVIDAAMSAKEA